MKISHLTLITVALMLSACSPSHRPVYSGHEEPTAGVPGFVDGKKVSPHVKLGQSYTVDGETYVPRNQPDYVEEGMASWYGPGFHGGKTANGERFDSSELTAAHRTLPLPSIVRVTMLSTGKQVYVRINDRGPFAHSRIIDLSRGAAEKIGLLQAGVGKVRVEYMKKESERFAELLSLGREPKSIDVASEVLNYDANNSTPQYARGDVRVPSQQVASTQKPGSAWDRFNPVSSAQASEPEVMQATDGEEEIAETSNQAAPVSSVASADLPAVVSAPRAKQAMIAPSSPFAAMDKAGASGSNVQEVAMVASPQPGSVQPAAAAALAPASAAAEGYYIQLGAFLKDANAQRAQSQFAKIGKVEVVQKPNAKGQMLFHVRMGPYASQQEGNVALAKVQAAGGEEARVIHE